MGVTPTGPEVEYGWIVGGARIGQTGGVAVARFEEKPAPRRAEQLWRRGGTASHDRLVARLRGSAALAS